MWDNSFLMDAVSGIEERLEEIDHSLHICNAYDLFSDASRDSMEERIYDLSQYSRYDGVIVACNTVGNKNGIRKALDRFRAAGIPAVNLGSRVDGDAFVNVDYQKSIYGLTEHLIKEHGYRRINYIGGTKTTLGSKMRLKGFMDCLEDNGIEVDKDRILQLNYLYEDGIEAYEIFKRRGLHLADAIICANDNTALGYCDAAGADGYYAPKDFAITGFDGITEAREYEPSITTVNPDWESMGFLGADILLKLIDRQEVNIDNHSPGRLLQNKSCGCVNEHEDSRMVALAKLNRNRRKRQIDVNLKYMFQNISCAENAEDMLKKFTFMDNSLKMPLCALCINEKLLEGEKIDPDEGFGRRFKVMSREGIGSFTLDEGVIPRHLKNYFDRNILMFSPLYFNDIMFGYAIMQYSDGMLDFVQNGVFFSYVSNALERMRLKLIIDKNYF